MNKKDTRIKLLNEVLNGIKVIKFYAWENPFKELITKIRKGELSILRKYTLLNAAYAFTWTCAPFIVSESIETPASALIHFSLSCTYCR